MLLVINMLLKCSVLLNFRSNDKVMSFNALCKGNGFRDCKQKVLFWL